MKHHRLRQKHGHEMQERRRRQLAAGRKLAGIPLAAREKGAGVLHVVMPAPDSATSRKLRLSFPPATPWIWFSASGTRLRRRDGHVLDAFPMHPTKSRRKISAYEKGSF